MASIVTIGLAEGEARSIKIEPGKAATKTFTVTNIFGKQLRTGFNCQFDKAEQKDWAKVRGAVERDMGDQGSEQITVEFTPPKNAAPGKYTFKLLVFSLKDPDLNFTVSDPIVIEIPQIEKQSKPIWPWLVAAAAVLLLIGGVLTWVLWPKAIEVPDVVGKPVDEALTLLQQEKLEAVIHERITGKMKPTYVISQNPLAKAELKKDDDKKVNLEVELFSVAVPELKGMTLEKAAETLQLASMKPGQVTEKRSGAQPGTVLSSEPASGQRVAPGAEIKLVIEDRDVLVPNVAGQRLQEATQVIQSLGLRTNAEMVRTGAEPLRVLSTRPVAGTSLNPGQTVTLVVEKQMIAVPNLMNQNINTATQILRNSNLQVGAVRYQLIPGRPAHVVFQQIPAPGASVEPLTQVTLYVSQGFPFLGTGIVTQPFTNVQTLNSLQTIRREAPPLEPAK